jgi:hypothetical protein
MRSPIRGFLTGFGVHARNRGYITDVRVQIPPRPRATLTTPVLHSSTGVVVLYPPGDDPPEPPDAGFAGKAGGRRATSSRNLRMSLRRQSRAGDAATPGALVSGGAERAERAAVRADCLGDDPARMRGCHGRRPAGTDLRGAARRAAPSCHRTPFPSLYSHASKFRFLGSCAYTSGLELYRRFLCPPTGNLCVKCEAFTGY